MKKKFYLLNKGIRLWHKLERNTESETTAAAKSGYSHRSKWPHGAELPKRTRRFDFLDFSKSFTLTQLEIHICVVSFVQFGGSVFEQQSNLHILWHSSGGHKSVRTIAHLRQWDNPSVQRTRRAKHGPAHICRVRGGVSKNGPVSV